MTESHYDESANPPDTSDNRVAERAEAAEHDEVDEATDADEAESEPDEPDEPAEPAKPHDAAPAEPDDAAPAEPDDAEPVADPRVRDAVRRLDDLSDLPPAEHVEVYEAVHSSLQESLAEASRQADESPPDGTSPS